MVRLATMYLTDCWRTPFSFGELFAYVSAVVSVLSVSGQKVHLLLISVDYLLLVTLSIAN